MPSSDQVASAAGITYRQLDYWLRAGYLGPGKTGFPGSGTRREWTVAEAEVARVMGLLVRAGLVPRTAAAVARSASSGRPRYMIAPGIVIELTGPDERTKP